MPRIPFLQLPQTLPSPSPGHVGVQQGLPAASVPWAPRGGVPGGAAPQRPPHFPHLPPSAGGPGQRGCVQVPSCCSLGHLSPGCRMYLGLGLCSRKDSGSVWWGRSCWNTVSHHSDVPFGALGLPHPWVKPTLRGEQAGPQRRRPPPQLKEQLRLLCSLRQSFFQALLRQICAFSQRQMGLLNLLKKPSQSSHPRESLLLGVPGGWFCPRGPQMASLPPHLLAWRSFLVPPLPALPAVLVPTSRPPERPLAPSRGAGDACWRGTCPQSWRLRHERGWGLSGGGRGEPAAHSHPNPHAAHTEDTRVISGAQCSPGRPGLAGQPAGPYTAGRQGLQPLPAER